MPKLKVSIKHSGKPYDVELDTEAPPITFKQSIKDLTGVPVDRMKVMIKGGMLKDETDWRKVAPKAGQTFMVIGTASELPKPPEKPIVFLEDMDDSSIAQALATPVGLVNLGNTCYMNATLQAMRAIPELNTALQSYEGGSDNHASLTASLRDLYKSMAQTTEGVTPFTFLNLLRQVVPQFNEMSRGGANQSGRASYAQQDADECWTALVAALRSLPGDPALGENSSKKFVEQYMMGEITQELKCDDAPEEPATTSTDKIMKIECNIKITTNFLMAGIKDGLDEKIEKHSPSLNRTATYTKHSRLSRLPNNLTVHMVRFYWRRDINKKAKIMRRVKFPFELDVLELCTPELQAKLEPANTKMKEVDRNRRDRRKVRRRTKAKAEKEAKEAKERETSQSTLSAVPEQNDAAMAVDEAAGGELQEESVYREAEIKEIEALIHEDVKKDIGASVSGLYDLCGIVTHKGASADSGHYIGYVRKDALQPTANNDLEDDDEDWFKFDDDKVSAVRRAQITALEGGGEDSVAYILLYRGRAL